jgi:DNA-binding phage protein
MLANLQGQKETVRYMDMAITKDFRETVKARVETDPEFRRALLIEAVHAFLTRDVEVGKSILRDYINATVGFEELAEALDKQSKSLHRMLGPKGNPSSNNLFDILQVLQEREGIELEVVARQKAA